MKSINFDVQGFWAAGSIIVLGFVGLIVVIVLIAEGGGSGASTSEEPGQPAPLELPTPTGKIPFG